MTGRSSTTDRIESYVAHGGYGALHKALTSMSPEEVVEQVRISGIRGRGGAGYPTGNKWTLLASASGDEKYLEPIPKALDWYKSAWLHAQLAGKHAG